MGWAQVYKHARKHFATTIYHNLHTQIAIAIAPNPRTVAARLRAVAVTILTKHHTICPTFVSTMRWDKSILC